MIYRGNRNSYVHTYKTCLFNQKNWTQFQHCVFPTYISGTLNTYNTNGKPILATSNNNARIQEAGSPIYLCNTKFRSQELHILTIIGEVPASVSIQMMTPCDVVSDSSRIWLWLISGLLRHKLVIMLQSFACETLGQKPTNFHPAEFLTYNA